MIRVVRSQVSGQNSVWVDRDSRTGEWKMRGRILKICDRQFYIRPMSRRLALTRTSCMAARTTVNRS